MKQHYHARVAATGLRLPENCYSNSDVIEKIHAARQKAGLEPKELTSDWIEERIGIKSRYYFQENESLVDVSVEAVNQALAKAGWQATDLDFVILASISQSSGNNGSIIPATACRIQDALKAYNAFAYDMLAACSGFLYGMAQGVSFIESGMAKRGVVICSECQLPGLNFADHVSSVLIGDVATATLLEYSEAPEVKSMKLQSNQGPGTCDIISLPYHRLDQDGHRQSGHFGLQGKSVFKAGIKTMVDLTHQALQLNGLSHEDVDWFIYHQANGAMLRMVGDIVGFSPEKNLMNIDRLANTTGATIPSVLHMYIENGTISRGDTVCCVGFGGGVTAGNLVFRY